MRFSEFADKNDFVMFPNHFDDGFLDLENHSDDEEWKEPQTRFEERKSTTRNCDLFEGN